MEYLAVILIFLLFGILLSGSISYTIACSGIFRRLRNFVKNKSKFLGEGISCPWCVSHYITILYLVIMGVYSLIPDITNKLIIDYLIWLFAIQGFVGVLHFVLLRAYEPIAKMKAQEQIEIAKEKLYSRK